MTQRYCSLFDLPKESKYRFFEVDVSQDQLPAVFDGGDVVLHLAAITDAASSFKNKALVESVNYSATIRVAEACAQTGCALIYLSSTSVYGTQRQLVDEDCPTEDLQPQSPYAETKLREERIIQSLSAAGQLRSVICRFGTICGVSPGMRFHTAVNKFCWQAVMGQPLTVWRTALHQKRPYLVLDDAVAAIQFLIRNSLFDGRVYNVVTANLTVHDIIELIREKVTDIRIEYIDTPIMNQLSYEASSDRLRRQGFEFSGDMRVSIGETIDLLKGASATNAV